MSAILGLKLDVDTLRGYREGVPALLDLFDRLDIRSTMFFSMGPDNSGKAIRRVFRKGFLSKMRRTSAVSTYGLKTMLYGTLLPAPHIVESDPSILRLAAERGHECAVHAWDHVEWQDQLDMLESRTVRDTLHRAFGLFERVAGFPARSCAAPAWKVTEASLEVQDELGLDYCSDSRGREPFFPVWGGRRFSTLQIPSTLPTLDEILGLEGQSAEEANRMLLDGLHEGINVHTFHAEMEGIGQIRLFESFLRECMNRGVRFDTLGDIAKTLPRESLSPCVLEPGEIPGRAGAVALQGKEWQS
jgi:peptidoglycan/xylan/chitin deacetylase (PgdA/CDA1 family)